MSEILKPPAGASLPLVPRQEGGNVTRAVRSGDLVRVSRGVYAPARDWSALPPWEKYRARVRAAAIRHPDAVYCLEAAAAMHGLPVFGHPADVHALGGGSTRSRVSGGVTFHTGVEDREIVEAEGMLMTSVADTVVDIARVRHPAVGLAVADAALRHHPHLTVEQLVALNEARASSRGRRMARWVLHRASPLAESPLESVDRAVIEWLGFPDPELQVWIGGDRVDKWWPDRRIAGEGDGDLKYEGTPEQTRAAVRARHERDARLFRRDVTAVPHWGWPEAIAVDPLHALLRSAGLPIIRARDTARLSSLRRVLSVSSRALA